MGMNPEAVLFDYDGVLANSDAFNLAGLSLAAKQLELNFSRQDFDAHFAGRRLRDGALSYLTRHDCVASLDQFLGVKYTLDDQYLDYCVPYPVACAMVKACAKRFKLCLVSGSRRVLLDRFLDRYELADCFHSIVSGDDVVEGKPSPAPYLAALRKIGVTHPENAVAIEDSPAGIAAARSAGLRCIAVCQTHTASLLRDAHAVVASVAELADYFSASDGKLPIGAVEPHSSDGSEEGASNANGTAHQVEVLQVSSLEDLKWPAADPHNVPQKMRAWCDRDVDLVRECAQAVSLDIREYMNNARKQGWGLPQQIMGILAHQKFQMNPAKSVREEPKWIESVERAVKAEKPIEIVYPQFCVIPNAPKRYTNTGPAAGEDCTIEFVKHINSIVKQIYPPGILMHALADASLYASAFQTHQTEVDAYFEMLGNRVKTLNASDCLQLHDYAALLRARCNPDYQILYYEIGRRVWSGDPKALLPHTDITTLRRSVRCSVNTRRFQLTHKDHMLLFGPPSAGAYSHSLFATLEQMTDIALREVITVRLACGEIDIATRLWPQALRATCHKGPKNGRWPIGLKTYPEYYGSCKLLPYHGMPLISRNSKGRPKLTIEPEVLLRSRLDLVRVMSSGDEVYAYIEQGLHDQHCAELSLQSMEGMRCKQREAKA